MTTQQDFQITLKGETRLLSELGFFEGASVGAPNKQNVVQVVQGDYTLDVSPTSIRYRHKPKGGRGSTPVKVIRDFGELDKLFPPKAVATEEDSTQNIMAKNAEEEKVMAKLIIDENTSVEITEDAAAVYAKHGFEGDVTSAQHDEVLAKSKGADKAALSALEKTIKVGEGTEIQTSSLFNSESAPAPKPARVRTAAQREAARLAAKQKKEENELAIQQNASAVEKLRKENASIEGAEEVIDSLRKLVLIDGKIPMFKTLVNTDTRLRADIKNLVKDVDRVWHPAVAASQDQSKTGKDIPAKYALGEYEVKLVESAPSSPSGAFIWVPESIIDFTPSQFAMYSERKAIIDAAEGFTPGGKLVAKLFIKSELVALMALLDAHVVPHDGNSYINGAPYLYLRPVSDKKLGVTVLALRAATAEGATTKLSIRHFLPLNTFRAISTADAEYDVQLTTEAFFRKTLFTPSADTQADKFSQLTAASQAKFTTQADGSKIFNDFKTTQSVQAYDSTAAKPEFRDVDLPKVVMSTPPANSTSVPKPVFVRDKHTDTENYSPLYRAALQTVGDQINKTRRQTSKSLISAQQEKLAIEKVRQSIFNGIAPNFK